MLRSLAIRDFTIIDRLDLEFSDGFGAITGETGAGKSILIDALAQLLGERGDSTLVAGGARQADLTATFEIDAAHPAQAWLEEHALDGEELVLLRRVIPAEGASRAWINGQPSTIAQLRALGDLLVEIHGQHEHQNLTRAAWQRQWLDRHVDESVRLAVAASADKHARAVEALEELRAEAGTPAERELLAFQVNELTSLALAEGELEQLEQEQRRLGSVDDLKRGIGNALDALTGDQQSGATAALHLAIRALDPLRENEPELSEAGEMLATAEVNLEEASRLLQRLQDNLEHDPERLAEVEQRLTRAMDLARKHRVEPERLPELTGRLQQRLERIDSHEQRREALESALAEDDQHWRACARKLFNARKKAGTKLSGDIAAALARLGMDGARVEFALEHDDQAEVSRHGADRIEILFSANPGQAPRPLARIASGGELSRFSLAMIVATADAGHGQVRIFDEIDAGVGGETAHAVGRFLHRAARGGQAFCVTHLAQVAACADAQWRVVKQPESDATRVAIERLDKDQRIEELARMLGSASSSAGRKHASALLREARKNR